MRRMLVSRISRRVLAEHHLALTKSLMEQEQSADGGGNVGIIFTGLSVKRSLDKFIKLLPSQDSMPERLRQGLLLLGVHKIPEIIVDGQIDTTFSYIREHLEYILLELLLNVSLILP
jgi:pyruvate dehydrogenase kinase 2/3/4